MEKRKTRSTTRNRWRMRCSNTRKCGQRFTLRRHPDEYKRRSLTMCPSCGGHAYIDEGNRRKELAKQDTCHCHNIPFPHRRGSVLGCESHPKPMDQWTIDDERDYEAMLATPRTGWS